MIALRSIHKIALCGAAMVIALFAALLGSPLAQAAATPRPAWSILSVAGPTNFIPGDESQEERYRLYITNIGSLPTDGSPITIADSILPAGVIPTGIVEAKEFKNGEELSCTTTPLRCTDSGVVPAGDILSLTIVVKIEPSASGTATNTVTVSGGGAAPVSTSTQNPLSAQLPPFAINEFSFGVTGVGGAPESQAGAHPYAVSTTLDFNTQKVPPIPGEGSQVRSYMPVQNVKDVVVDLPLGLLGNALATPRCPLFEMELRERNEWLCPANTKVGEVTLRSVISGAVVSSVAGNNTEAPVSPIFNLVPEAGHPAEFGFAISEIGRVHLFPSVVRTSAGYVLRVTAPNTLAEPAGFGGEKGFLDGSTLTLFGDPGLQDGGGSPPAPFFTNPVDCSGSAQNVTVHVDTWTQQGRVNADGTPDFSDPNWLETKSSLPHVTGCEALKFHPKITFAPSTTQADSPTGATFGLLVPQAPNSDAVPATPELKDATVALPPGLSLSPSAANGLEACTPAQFDLEHNAAKSACPDHSKIAEVEVKTPLLEEALAGHLYVAQPACGGGGQHQCTEADAANGSLFGVYLEAEGRRPKGESDGVIVKLEGRVSVNPTTGQLTTTFKENPQLPFSELQIRLDGGPRAPLATSQSCGGPMTATSDLVPWSRPYTPDATPPSHPFEITGCASPIPFTPAFSAGTVTARAASFSPFTLTLSRGDGQQSFSAISTTLPPGLVGMLSQVPPCGEPQAQQGSCPEASRIGSTTVAAGSGPQPFWLSGKVYLTGPYNGAPFGLSVVVPAKAGPFNLGNEIVRAAINIDPHTSAVTVTSGPIPQIKDGVPLRLKTINVTIDRPGFMLNPTNCEGQRIKGTIAAAQGASVSVESPFAVGGCASLAFKPSFTVATQARTSRAFGASLDVKVSYPSGGEANIKAVRVELPLQLPSRLTTLNKACLAATFQSNPATCPTGSIVGIAKASTPLLPVVLSGPAYLVSHANESFPQLVVVLQGEGVRVDLTGDTLIRKGITSSTFASVPDVPVSSFELYLPEGTFSALAANADLCKGKLQMPTKITGQNGAVIKQATIIKVIGCSAAKKTRTGRKPRKGRKAKKANSSRTAPAHAVEGVAR